MISAWMEALFELRAIRWTAAIAFLCRGGLWWAVGRRYRAMVDFCWVVRVSNVPSLQRLAERVVFGVLAGAKRSGHNPLVDWYRADRASQECAELFSLTGHGSADLLRDLIVLKSATAEEKGVILLKYARTFSAVVAMFDLRCLMDRYQFVLEPCWAGYCDPALLMFVAPGQPVVVQCFTEADHAFISRIGKPLFPVRLGPADWVDADVFDVPPATSKQYDLVMVANWASHKRHALLFRALQDIRDRHIHVLLVGFPWASRTADDIRREAAASPSERVHLEIVESIPHAELAKLLHQCKVFVFLSKKEGDNKALVEAMFADVPAIVYDRTIGGAGSRVNEATGMFASEQELAAKIDLMLDHHDEFSPRRWALEHTGSAVATGILNDALHDAATSTSGVYAKSIVEKTNAPNLAYKNSGDRVRFQDDYDFIFSCRLGDGQQ